VHSARHTALTNLGLTGVDPFTLQRAAGHANITTTRKYVHPTPPAIKDAKIRGLQGVKVVSAEGIEPSTY